MRANFTLRLYKDEVNNIVLSSLQNITIADITLISKLSKFEEICVHNGNQKKFGYKINILGKFNKVSGSHSTPTLSFKGNYIDIEVVNFPRYPAFYQATYAARNCLNGYGYVNEINNGFAHQLKYRKIEIINNKLN